MGFVSGRSFYIEDDFSDCRYTNRKSRSKPTTRRNSKFRSPVAQYPTWSVPAGSWNATAGYLHRDTNAVWAVINTPSTQAYGTWIWKFRYDNITSVSRSMFYFISPTAEYGWDGYYGIWVGEATSFDLYKLGDPLASFGWTGDFNWHEVKVTRTNAGVFDVYLDDVWKGTFTDTTYTTSVYIKIMSNSDAGNHYYDNLRVK